MAQSMELLGLLHGGLFACMVKLMQQARPIWFLGMGIVMGASLCSSLSHAGSMKDTHAPIGFLSSSMTGPSAIQTGKDVEPAQMLTASSVRESPVALRTITTLSTQVSVGSLTLVPYLGAGFGGGYATELDRSLHTTSAASALSSSANAGLRNLFGQQLIPNEVQLGIRFPF